MKVMTFNIQHCLDYKRQRIDFNLFADKIKEYNPDFCGLNEVRGKGFLWGYTDQTGKLSKKTGYYGYFGQAIKVLGRGPYGNAFLSKKPFESAETVIVPDPEVKTPGRHYETRCIIKTVIRECGRDILFLVTHMGLSEEERKGSVAEICRIVDSTDMPVILMGDFNACPDESVLKPLFERFSDTLEGCDVKTYPSDKPEIKIDYILYRGVECKNTKVIEEVVSDHFPIITEVII